MEALAVASVTPAAEVSPSVDPLSVMVSGARTEVASSVGSCSRRLKAAPTEDASDALPLMPESVARVAPDAAITAALPPE